MFPWLFPYGLGGIGQLIHKGVIAEDTQKENSYCTMTSAFSVILIFLWWPSIKVKLSLPLLAVFL